MLRMVFRRTRTGTDIHRLRRRFRCLQPCVSLCRRHREHQSHKHHQTNQLLHNYNILVTPIIHFLIIPYGAKGILRGIN